MTLPGDLNNRIVKFLESLPNIADSNGRQALIGRAGLDEQLQSQVKFSGPKAQFVSLLIPILVEYGQLDDGRNALEAILEATKDSVGQQKRRICESLIRELRTVLNGEGSGPLLPHQLDTPQGTYLYYIATTDEHEFAKKYPIDDNKLKKTVTIEKADITIFDLDHPPCDWPKYLVGEYFHHEHFIFVASTKIDPSLSEPVNGVGIWSIINKCYEVEAEVSYNQGELVAALSRAKNTLRRSKQQTERMNSQYRQAALAFTRQSAHEEL